MNYKLDFTKKKVITTALKDAEVAKMFFAVILQHTLNSVILMVNWWFCKNLLNHDFW